LGFTNALALVIVMLVVSTFGSIWLGSRLLQTNMFSPMMVNVEQRKEQGYVGIDMDLYNKVGKQGIAHTILRPSGKVLIDEIVYDATSELAYVEKGKFIEVIRFENNQLVVRQIE
jgi:membrane-bound serine protease (ClpP class)